MDATISDKTKGLFQKITQFLHGAFDNFQQAWQENTEEELHRVEVKQKHRHWHIRLEKSANSTETEVYFLLRFYENRSKDKIAAEQELSIIYDSVNNQVISSLKSVGLPVENIVWTMTDQVIDGRSKNDYTVLKIIDNQLIIQQKEGLFKNPAPYNFLKCRFFSGFIEIPNPDQPDTMIRMGDLVMHDQGDMVQFTYPNGQKGSFIVELTQLVFAKQLAIMKLGVYDEPIANIHYSSRAMSYTWTNPDAKRIGINLRKVLTGWTLMEPGFVSSNNMDLERKEGGR